MKLLFCCLTAASLIFSSTLSFAAPKYWIERDGGAFGSEYLTDGKSQFAAGMFGTFDWVEEAEKNPAFADIIVQRNNDLKKGQIIYWTGFAFVLVSVFAPRDYFWPVLLGGLGLNIWGAHFGLKARQQDLEMINRSNGVPPKSAGSSTFEFNRRFKTAETPLLTLALTF